MPTFRDQITDGQIILTVGVSLPVVLFEEDYPPPPAPATFEALVDTGAQMTMVTERVVRQIGARPTGTASFLPANGEPQEAKAYWLSVDLPIAMGNPPQMAFSHGRNLNVMQLPFQPQNFDLIVGMDLLCHYHLSMYGDLFVLSN